MTEPSSPALPARRSDRLAELRDEVAQVTVVHETGVRRGRPDGAVAVAGLDGVNVAFVRYGAEVTVDAFPTRNRFALTVPLGPMRVRAPGIADGGIVPGPFVLAADAHTLMEPDPVAGALVVSAGAGRLEEQLAALTGRPPGHALQFLPPGAATPAAPPSLLEQAWRTTCAVLTECGGRPAPLVRRVLSEQLLTAVLLTQPHTASDALRDEAAAGPADAVDRALAWIEAHHAEPVTVAAIARAAGVGVRRLQEEFRRRLGTGPATVLREVRLARAHRALVEADATTVADVAHACGFGHLGRFAHDYRDRYGELPSDTARRRRA
ncbi:AraC family transcriptional regulator [Pseudonocardia alni subsp. carboxydivorans]|uniref:Helix-turn-helix domain-containing protein n=1 Tax=Pseudonocardia alni subsp. carboxydivorans TaxID=415010 RepID=A0ABU9AE15_PSEA5